MCVCLNHVSSCLAGLRGGCCRAGRGGRRGEEEEEEGALCEVLEGLADPHAGPVEGPGQGDENQEQQHGPGGIDPLVGLGLHPRPGLEEISSDTKRQFQTLG